MPERNDHWWTLTSNTDLMSLSNEVIIAVEKYGLPAIQDKQKSA